MNQLCSSSSFFRPELVDPRLDARARLPLRLHRLVAADVDPRARENVSTSDRTFCMNVMVDGSAFRMYGEMPHTDRGSTASFGAPELRIRGDDCLRMARHLDFRHDGHVPRRRVAHHFADIVLGVETTMTDAVEPLILVTMPADEGLLAPRGDRRQLRVLLDLQAPSLIVGEVPVEAVHLVQREEVDVLLDELLGLEVTRDVEVRASPAKARHVLDRHHRHLLTLYPLDRCVAKDRRRQELTQRLHAVEHAGRRRGARDNAIGADRQRVALGAQALQGRILPQRNGTSGHRAFHLNVERVAGRRLQITGKLTATDAAAPSVQITVLGVSVNRPGALLMKPDGGLSTGSARRTGWHSTQPQTSSKASISWLFFLCFFLLPFLFRVLSPVIMSRA